MLSFKRRKRKKTHVVVPYERQAFADRAKTKKVPKHNTGCRSSACVLRSSPLLCMTKIGVVQQERCIYICTMVCIDSKIDFGGALLVRNIILFIFFGNACPSAGEF